MNDIKRFKLAAIIRYGFDLARIFPIIINHRGTSKIISKIYPAIEAQLASWQNLLKLEYLM